MRSLRFAAVCSSLALLFGCVWFTRKQANSVMMPGSKSCTVGIINLPAFILGFPLETLAGFPAFRGLWAIFIHSNVRLPIGPLCMLIGAPELHHWHHDKARDAGNYANISPLMDIFFGTYRCLVTNRRPSASTNRSRNTTSASSGIRSGSGSGMRRDPRMPRQKNANV